MLRSVIVDDEERNINVLKSILDDQCPDLQVSGTAGSIAESLNLIPSINPDLVFLDVELADGMSFEILSQLEHRNFEIIFITAYNHYAVKAFRFAAIDYLLKPVNPFELKAAVQKASEKKLYQNLQQRIDLLLSSIALPRQRMQRIALPTLEGLYFIDLDDIIKIEAEGSYSVFHLKEHKKIMVSKSLKDYEDLLEGDDFIRIHHSFVINLAQVKKYIKGSGGYVVMNDDSKVDVSIRRKEEFLKRVRT
jgi:two-component system LytT family response regulator